MVIIVESWIKLATLDKCLEKDEGRGEQLERSRENDPTSSRTSGGLRCAHVHDGNAKLLALGTMTYFATQVPFVSCGLEDYSVISRR